MNDDLLLARGAAHFDHAISTGSGRKSFAFSLSRYALPTIRVLFGLIFFVCGLNGFLNFLPQPSTPMPAGAVAFGTALMQTGYMFPLIKGTEVAASILLLSNRFVPLALVLLAPVTVNIFAFHAILTPGQAGFAAVLVAIHLLLAWSRRVAYRPLFVARA
jgi:hypothetical protein